MTSVMDWAELQRFPNSAAACLVKSRLSQDGIRATVRRGSRYQALGGAGWIVTVPVEQLAEARALLDRSNPEIDLDEYVDENSRAYRRCPGCRSVMLEQRPLTSRQRLLAIGTLGAGLWLITRHFRCRKCGTVWDAR